MTPGPMPLGPQTKTLSSSGCSRRQGMVATQGVLCDPWTDASWTQTKVTLDLRSDHNQSSRDACHASWLRLCEGLLPWASQMDPLCPHTGRCRCPALTASLDGLLQRRTQGEALSLVFFSSPYGYGRPFSRRPAHRRGSPFGHHQGTSTVQRLDPQGEESRSPKT